MTFEKFEDFFEVNSMGNRLSVLLNGHRYTCSGANWVDDTGTVVPTFLCPALDAALGTTADSRKAMVKASSTITTARGINQRVKRKRKG
jgi:hypothetical protein